MTIETRDGDLRSLNTFMTLAEYREYILAGGKTYGAGDLPWTMEEYEERKRETKRISAEIKAQKLREANCAIDI